MLKYYCQACSLWFCHLDACWLTTAMWLQLLRLNFKPRWHCTEILVSRHDYLCSKLLSAFMFDWNIPFVLGLGLPTQQL